MHRLTKDQWAMHLVDVTANRSTCLSRQVGCILTDIRGHVLATGYNGAASGLPHCTDTGVCYKSGFQSGLGLDHCVATHAEQNALLQCHDVYKIHTVYVSASPCVTCTKLLMNTSAKRIVFRNVYPHTLSKDLWCHKDIAGRTWERFQNGTIVEISYSG